MALSSSGIVLFLKTAVSTAQMLRTYILNEGSNLNTSYFCGVLGSRVAGLFCARLHKRAAK